MRPHTSHPVKVRGRDAIIEEIDGLLAAGTTRVVTLSGLAGVGKTRIVRHVCARRAATSSNPATEETVWVDARGPGELVDALLDAVGILDVRDRNPATAGAALDIVPRLIVIDRADAAPDAAATLGPLIASTDTTRWLITSRAPLRVDAERVIRVDPFRSSARAGGTAPVELHPGVEIFFDVAAQFGQRWSADGETLADVVAIVDQLGGLPGAIEIAASRTAALSPATIRRLLDRSNTKDLVVGGRDATELFGAVRWSVSLLGADQRRLLHDMTVFSGAVPIEAITAVTGVPIDVAIDLVADLIDVHLLDARHDGGVSVFSLNPVVRQHALSGMSTVDLDLQTRHTRWAVAVADAADSIGGADPDVITCERDLVAALRRALIAGSGDDAAILAVSLAPLWIERGARASQLDLMREVSELVKARGTEPALAAPAIALAALLAADRALHDVDVRAVIVERDVAVAMCRQCGRPTRLAVLGAAVRTARIIDERAVAVALCDEGLELARELGDQRSLARFEIWSGMLAHQELRIDDAVEMARSALDRARRVDDARLVVAAAGLLRTLPIANDPDVVIPSASELVEAARQCGDRRSLTWLLPTAAAEALRRGDLSSAAAATVSHLTSARSSAAWNLAAISMVNLTWIAESSGDRERAARFHGMLATHWPVLRRGLPPAFAAGHEALITQLRASFGDERFDAIAGSGALLSFADATAEALHYAQSLTDAATDTDRGDTSQPEDTPLTGREDEILARLIEGETNKQIARVLGITPKTVMHHTSSIYRKLGVRGRAEAVAWGVRNAQPAGD